MFGVADKTAPPRRVSGLAGVIGKRTHASLVGAHLRVRPCTEAACCSGPTHGSAPTGVAKVFCILMGLRMFRSCSGRGCCARRIGPAPTKRAWLRCRGAPVCAPVHESGMLQRADTSVGPYRGGKGVWYFGGVASVGFVQRAGHAPPLQSNHADPYTRKERHMALRLVYCSSFYEYKYAYPGSGPAGPVREGGMESRGSGGPVQGPPILWP